MAISFVAAGVASTTDGGTAPTPGMPAGITDGDASICLFYSRNVTTGALAVSSVATAVGANAVYTGTFPNGGSNAYNNYIFVVAGFVATAANNGSFTCSASTTTTLTLGNSAAVSETVAATATSTGTVTISSGWDTLYNDASAGGLLALFTRTFQTGDTAPTFTLASMASGAAGDDCLAQIAAWRGARAAQPVSVPGTIATNTAATNIGAITGPTAPANGVVIAVGGKLDDYTSVATLTTGADALTWTEIAETKSTAGADAGMIWDYALIGAADVAVSTQTFTVTGGTAVAGKGVMLAMTPIETRVHPPRRNRIAIRPRCR